MRENQTRQALESLHAFLYWLPVVTIGAWSLSAGHGATLMFLVVLAGLGLARLVELLLSRRRIEEAGKLGHIDALTGLPNRRALTAQLYTALSKERPLQALLLVDMDRFKVINDTLGHPVGDEFLCEVAERLRALASENVFVSRFGGDEFTLVLENLRDERDARRMAARLLDSLGQPLMIRGNEIVPGASIGIAIAAKPKPSPDELLSQADIALYQAKARGRGRYEVYRPGFPVPSKRLLTIGAELKVAMEAKELRLVYQPVVELANMRPVGFEALVRWDHPTMGSLLPADFIPLAEQAGLMRPLGAWILSEACRQAKEWQDVFGMPVCVSVNLSALQFQNLAFLSELSSVLDATGVDSTALALEITESALIEDDDVTEQNLGRLHDLGISVAIDNFGVGYSSLGQLRRCKVQMLKIDHCFVRDIEDPITRSIIESVVALGHSLGMTVVAEGIETETQMRLLASTGCDLGQGFLFQRPLEVREVNKVLAAGSSRDLERYEASSPSRGWALACHSVSQPGAGRG